jgi:hypothetical protein
VCVCVVSKFDMVIKFSATTTFVRMVYLIGKKKKYQHGDKRKVLIS